MSEFTYKKKKGKGKIIAIIIAIAAAAAAAAGFFIYRYAYESKERLAPVDFYKVGELGSAEGIIVINGEVQEERAYFFNGIGYLPLEFVDRELNDRFYFDKETDGILYTNGEGTMTLKPGEREYTSTSGQKVTETSAPLIKSDDKFYLDVAFVSKYTPMIATTASEPNRVAITYGNTGWESAEALEDTVVRYYAGIKSNIVADLKAGDKMMTIQKEGDWTKVYTADGFTGYVKTSKISETSEFKQKTADEDTYKHNQVDTPVSLAWFAVTNAVANQNAEEQMKDIKGLDIIAPTWYSFADNKGTINDFSEVGMVEDFHNKGLKVWPVVNDFTNDVNIKEILSSKAVRGRMIERLMSDATYMKYDGINVDFETITNDSSKDFLQFVRELSVECHKNNIVLSIDDYPPKGYNAYYDMEEQGQYVDYVILMNYDEHYAGSEEPGSVSSIGFVNEGIADALEHVPANKIINALPFYTRIWGVDESGKIVSNASAGMKDAAENVAANNGKINWDDFTGQNVATYKKDGANYSIWLEDAKSMKLKLDATKENNLAGVAFWRLGYETPDIWDLVVEYKK